MRSRLGTRGRIDLVVRTSGAVETRAKMWREMRGQLSVLFECTNNRHSNMATHTHIQQHNHASACKEVTVRHALTICPSNNQRKRQDSKKVLHRIRHVTAVRAAADGKG